MTEPIITTMFVVMLAFFALALNVGTRKSKKKVFPTCFQCDVPMVQIPVTKDRLPDEIERYLVKHNLPRNVVRRFICAKGHRELWVTPAVGSEKKGVIVSRKI